MEAIDTSKAELRHKLASELTSSEDKLSREQIKYLFDLAIKYDDVKLYDIVQKNQKVGSGQTNLDLLSYFQNEGVRQNKSNIIDDALRRARNYYDFYIEEMIKNYHNYIAKLIIPYQLKELNYFLYVSKQASNLEIITFIESIKQLLYSTTPVAEDLKTAGYSLENILDWLPLDLHFYKVEDIINYLYYPNGPLAKKLITNLEISSGGNIIVLRNKLKNLIDLVEEDRLRRIYLVFSNRFNFGDIKEANVTELRQGLIDLIGMLSTAELRELEGLV
jgi:hypothetical protein